MTPQPVSIRQPEIDALVAGSMTVLIRPIGRLASAEHGALLWVREPFHLPKALDVHKPTRAVALGATPIFATDHSPAWFAHHCARTVGRRRMAREMPKAWHRQHLRVIAIEQLPLHDVATVDLRTAGWRSRSAFEIRWDADARFGGYRGNEANLYTANPQVLRIVFERIAAPLPKEE
jgi:hypothetical protein